MGRLTISRYRHERIILTEGDAQVILTVTRVSQGAEKCWLKVQHSRYAHPQEERIDMQEDLILDIAQSQVVIRLHSVPEQLLVKLTITAPSAVRVQWVPPCSS